MEENKLETPIKIKKGMSIEKLYKSSFKIFIDNIVVCIANTVILGIVCFLFAITIIGLLALPGIVGGYIGSMIRLINGEQVEIGDFIKIGLNSFGPLLGAKVIYQLGAFVGCLFFILPGIYLMIRWAFVNHIIINENKSVSDAFSSSSKMTSGILWDILVILILNAIISTILIGFFFILLLQKLFS